MTEPFDEPFEEPFEDLDDWAEDDAWDEAGSLIEQGLGFVLREVLSDEYDGADEEDYDHALEVMLDGMSPAEAIGFANAFRQIQGGASRALAVPFVAQGLRTALPTGAAALGTLIGGPAGNLIGTRLGTLAAGALAGRGTPPQYTAVPTAPPQFIPVLPQIPGVPSPPPAITPAIAPPPGFPAIPAGAAGAVPAVVVEPPAPVPAVAEGSAAAAQGLVLACQPDVLAALLALCLGRHGARRIGGVPVARVMGMLSDVFAQAAADADELAYHDGLTYGADESATGFGEETGAGPSPGSGRALYTAFMDAENEELAS
ncbi:hypothetical protein FXF51_53675 [Nonomuraea sp. PA05]|uniref:hypothetical protein n=1 Tax=Nonomuraea sp. PA05 TaxID=2604466 RepID=UPI0011D99AFF|nr:hypothetical protein [Nonomuraea sp. PA05]TYB51332.1 hypothetical protein FXF51_53675 [Nonomuraea sp. PA05]